MDKDFNDFNNMNFSGGYMNGFDMNDPMFNPVLQYEQAFTYYKYLCMQMDYKIKCKEYEKICSELSRNNTGVSGISQNKNT